MLFLSSSTNFLTLSYHELKKVENHWSTMMRSWDKFRQDVLTTKFDRDIVVSKFDGLLQYFCVIDDPFKNFWKLQTKKYKINRNLRFLIIHIVHFCLCMQNFVILKSLFYNRNFVGTLLSKIDPFKFEPINICQFLCKSILTKTTLSKIKI